MNLSLSFCQVQKAPADSCPSSGQYASEQRCVWTKSIHLATMNCLFIVENMKVSILSWRSIRSIKWVTPFRRRTRQPDRLAFFLHRRESSEKPSRLTKSLSKTIARGCSPGICVLLMNLSKVDSYPQNEKQTTHERSVDALMTAHGQGEGGGREKTTRW